jgi:predicted unusual protein kinase regulating ubiquinone biosynthesis (AarF/ABC1/UbiB family)
MERPYIQGLCLNDLLTTKLSTNLSTKQITLLTDTLWQQVISWSICGFIHGDLSPANILYHPQTPQKLYFIDWLLDLRKPAGTPRYCEPRLLFCKNNAEKDQYAMAKIIKEIKINTF